MIFPVWSIHRDPRWWDDPDCFVPERFLPYRPAPKRGTYLPFGAGRRICVGAAFAQMEGIVLTAMIARRYHFASVAAVDVVPEPTVTLRPRNGLPMTLTSRS